MSPSGFFRAALLTFLALAAPTRAADVAPRMLLLAGAPAGSDAIIAVGERATILRTTDSARTWQAASVPAGTSTTLTGLSFAPDGQRGWAVGHDALILATVDAGRTWQKSWQGENLTESFLDVLALDARHILAVGAYGFCVESKDAGTTWTRRKILTDDLHLNRLTRGPTGTLYLAGERGTLLRSVDAGATWQPIESPYDGSFYGILPLDKNTLVAHGLRGRLYRSADDGRSWEMVQLADRVLLAATLKLMNALPGFLDRLVQMVHDAHGQHGRGSGNGEFQLAQAGHVLRQPEIKPAIDGDSTDGACSLAAPAREPNFSASPEARVGRHGLSRGHHLQLHRGRPATAVRSWRQPVGAGQSLVG